MRRRSLLSAMGVLPASAGAVGAVTLFAAISLQDALRAMARPGWRLAFAASSALARQMEQGAPADIFLSADEAWMDWAAARGLVVPASRLTVLGNALVLVAAAGAPLVAWEGLPGTTGRIALGDPAHVPAGRYAQEALQGMGLLGALTPRFARAENVRAALLLVERGEAPYAIVYATDALAVPGLRVAARFPENSHAPIRYPFALTPAGQKKPAAVDALTWLAGPDAAQAWRRHGFVLPA
ncbi:MAG TPA: molybdate ABC transporter substrate-binding protein [Roseococcus sp.]|jgi:molybdate transport system substrate-binding protein|nr:molybdate ABC transporter substrate-binding protein [Roseococcus sp.]